MSLPFFLTNLFETGTVQISKTTGIASEEKEEAQRLLTEFEREYRLSLAGVPPVFDAMIAATAAETLYRLCQCLVYREFIPGDLLSQEPHPPDSSRPAADHYSADLTYRFLPDAWRLTKEASEGDPLVTTIRDLAACWPLASVGIPGLPDLVIDGFVDDPSLLTLYVDRIIERRDKTRLEDRRVREAFLSAVGAHRELAPEMTPTETSD